jgi:general secretion pathway protein J
VIRKDDAGFTLLELLVTMTLLGLLSVALVASIRYGTRIWRATAATATSNSTMLTVREQLKELLGKAYPEYVYPTPTTGHILFDGTPDSIDFLAPDSHIAGGLAHVRIAGEQDGTAFALVATAAPELSNAPVPDAARRILLHNLAALEISYYGRDKPNNDQAEWVSEWRGMTVMPDLVRIRLQFAQTSARPWPELIIAPHIQSDISCTFDILTKSCAGR